MKPVTHAPGAGLPKFELMIARIRFGWALRRKTRAQFAELFASERDKILALARSCDPETGARTILIHRIRGMEDSSRYWSVFMTLDHLKIVNLAVATAIRSLAKGEVPQRTANTADVKPDLKADVTSIQSFEHSCDLFTKCGQKVPNLHTQVRYDHPWFGPLDAAGWHALGGIHMGIHRRQIEQILSGSDNSDTA
ncbi:MAG: hypothetical protein ACI9R3_004841 [Verrucomicrobiales bacterium]|jgi:hypothetical protein